MVSMKANTLNFVLLYDTRSTFITHILVTNFVTYSLTTVRVLVYAGQPWNGQKHGKGESHVVFNQLRDLEWRLDRVSKVRTGTQYFT